MAPWLHVLATFGAAHFASLQHLADMPFHRYVTRSFTIIALGGVWFYMGAIGMRSTAKLGLASRPGGWRDLWRAYLIAFACLAGTTVLCLLMGVRDWQPNLPAAKVISRILAALAAMVLVPLIEETLFRGALYGSLKLHYGRTRALWVSAFIYGLVHFFAPIRGEGAIHWDSGLWLLPQLFRGFMDWHALIPGLITLTLTGVVLAELYERTGSLHASIGFHAGLVVWIQSAVALLPVRPDANVWFWGSRKLIDGWVSLLIILVCLVICFKVWPQRPPPPEKQP